MGEPAEYQESLPEGATANIQLKKGFHPKIKLEPGKTAIYIGSSPTFKNIDHLLSAVDADNYILSDLGFSTDAVFKFADCVVAVTNKNGFERVKKDKSISFVLVDQAVPGIAEGIRFVQINAYVFIHTMYQQTELQWARAGLKQVNGNLFVKIRQSTADDLAVDEKLSELMRVFRNSSFQGINPPNYSSNITGQLSDHWDAEKYPGEGWILSAQDFIKNLRKLLPKLNDAELKDILARIQSLVKYLSTRNDKINQQLFIVFSEFLKSVSK